MSVWHLASRIRELGTICCMSSTTLRPEVMLLSPARRVWLPCWDSLHPGLSYPGICPSRCVRCWITMGTCFVWLAKNGGKPRLRMERSTWMAPFGSRPSGGNRRIHTTGIARFLTVNDALLDVCRRLSESSWPTTPGRSGVQENCHPILSPSAEAHIQLRGIVLGISMIGRRCSPGRRTTRLRGCSMMWG